MPLSPQPNRWRRLTLIASGALSVVVLATALVVPLWDAGAGGLERGERSERGRPMQQAIPRDQKSSDKRSDAGARGSSPTKTDGAPLSPPNSQGQTPVAVPLPVDPLRRPPISPQTSSRPDRPRTLPVPLPPADPRLADVSPERTGASVDMLKSLFRRPEPLSTPRGQAAAEIALGARLFGEKKLSADHRMSCATCHDPSRSFADGRRTARGDKGQSLPRNTPSLWNLSMQRAFYWDGRAPTLEAQIKDAIEREGEMDATLEAGVLWLSRDPSYVRSFEQVYGGQQALTRDNMVKALAAYERTLVSPATRFDRWVEGDVYALSDREIAGFRLFTGKARCLACHGGWRFTDDRFHDIGLRSKDPGRMDASGVGERAFKTSTLREAMWSAPYMHDGSLRSFDEVVAHYAGGLEDRPSLASELKRGISLDATERANLIAFLKTLSSDSQPTPPPP